MKCSIFFLIFSAIITVLYVVGIIFFLNDREPFDKCEMTYMFEFPQYVRVSQKIDIKYPKYGLYAYGEGRTTKKARSMFFDGIPVLFIPGNAGSHQQVRSLSSVALRKAINSGSPYHFDYFTVDLNSEFSALYGPVLYEQLEYVLNSVKRILELYKNSPTSPKKIVLIGHSVGGILAKRVVSVLEKNKSNLVSILINLATPLKRGPVFFDGHISAFYKKTKIFQNNITIVNIAGGYSDFLVPSYLTGSDLNNSINLVSTNIPLSWVESNHVQIVWCKQIVIALNRALFDSVDSKTHQISEDQNLIQRVFNHYLIYNSGTKHYLKPVKNEVAKIDYRGEWIESLYKQYTIEHKKGLKRPHWYMVGLNLQPSYEMLTVLAVNLEESDWIFVCAAAYPQGPSRVCVEAEHLSQYSEIAPTSRFKRRLVTLNLHELRRNNSEYSHVVFRALPTTEPLTFHVDVYGSYERNLEVSFPKFSIKKQVILEKTPEKALIYNLVFPELGNVLQIYELFVDPLHCGSENHHASASLVIPWANENVHAFFTESSTKPFLIRVQNVKPQGAESAKLRLILEPTCTYKISIRLHLLGIFGQIARYYSPFLLTYVPVVFLLAFNIQVRRIGSQGVVPIFFTALLDGIKYSWLIPAGYFLSFFLRYPFFLKFLPKPEVSFFPNKGEGIVDLVLAPLILFVVSVVIVLVLVTAYCISLFTLESTIHKLIFKVIARSVPFTNRFSEYFTTFLQKVPFVVAALLITLCFTTCGGLALAVGSTFYFLKLIHMSQEYVEQVVWFLIKKIGRKLKRAFSKKKKTNNVNLVTLETSQTHTKETVRLKKSKERLEEQENDDGEENKNDTTNENKTYESGIEPDLLDKTKNQIDENKTETYQEGNCNVLDTNNSELDNEQTQISESEERKEEYQDNLDRPNTLSLISNSIFFHSSMFFIWFLVTALNVPAVLTWAHNFKYSKSLVPDESFLPGLILSINALSLWQLDLPRTNRKFTNQLHLMILWFVLISIIYAPVSVYRLNYILTTLFALVMIQQCYAPKIYEENDNSTEESDASENTKKPEEKYDEIKRKID